MSGRYAFSLPDPRQRDGWFRLGNIDVTTTALLVGSGLISMFVYALSPELVAKGIFASEAVRSGEVWRLATWPFVGFPSIWELIGLAVFWFFGHQVEDQLGRRPYTWLVAAMTIIPALLVTLIGAGNEATGRWEAGTAGVSLLSLAFLTVFALEHPGARFFFGIPAWAVAAALIGVSVLSSIGARAWGTLWLTLLVVAVGLVGARQRGMLGDTLGFVPRVSWLSGPAPSPYGEVRSAKPKGRARGRSKGRRGSGPSVVQGPWAGGSGGPTPLEQAELDVLLDRISEGGLDSLSKQERKRLEELSRRFRES